MQEDRRRRPRHRRQACRGPLRGCSSLFRAELLVEGDRQLRFVGVYHEDREEFGRLRLAGIGTDAMAVDVSQKSDDGKAVSGASAAESLSYQKRPFLIRMLVRGFIAARVQ
jgi:hypothetical protein